MFNHLGSAAFLGRDWLHSPKQLQYRTIVEARKLIWNEHHLTEFVGMLCSHQNGMEKQVPQRMDHSKEQLMKNRKLPLDLQKVLLESRTLSNGTVGAQGETLCAYNQPDLLGLCVKKFTSSSAELLGNSWS